MPDGRFLSKTVANDWKLNNVSLLADYLFTRCIPHLDREGRLPGHPAEVKGIAAPLRADLTVEEVDSCLGELAAVGLVEWYDAGGRPCLRFPGFDKNQKGLRKEREADSRIPPPKGCDPIRSLLRISSGSTPELVRSRTGVGPAQVEVEGEVEVQGEVSSGGVSVSNESLPSGKSAHGGRDLQDGLKARGVLKDACFRGRTEIELYGTTFSLGVLVARFQELVDEQGWPPADLSAAIVEATLLPAGNEDRAPDGPWMLSWLEHRAGRIERLISAARKRAQPSGPRSLELSRVEARVPA